VRRGSVFRRCTNGKCGRRVEGRRCICGNERTTWVYVVDLAPPGSPERRQVMRGGFRTKELATAAMNKLQHVKAEGTYVERSKETVGEYLERWIKQLEPSGEVRGSTAIGWDVVVRHHLAPHIGMIRLQELTRDQVKSLYFRLAESGRADGEGGLSPKSVWNVHLCLHRALQDAVEDKLSRDNPADRAMRKPKDKPDIEFWTSDELEAFLAWIAGDPACDVRDQALYRITSQTGMRRGELLGLRWRAVDLENGLVTVIQQLARQRGARLGFGAPKTARGRRTINLSPETVNALQAVKNAQAFARRALGDAYEAMGDLVFCRDNGTRHDPDVVSKRFVRHVKKSGVRRLHFHGLRHTSAVIGLRELGEWPDECSRRLGHSSVAFTLETYGHLLPERGQNIAAAFDRLIAERRSKRAREHFVSI
jgi:integrase